MLQKNFKNFTLQISENMVVLLSEDGQKLLHSPEEGLWSIAAGWSNHAPEMWHHGSFDQVEETLRGVILSGTVNLPAGECLCRDFITCEHDILKVTRRWHYKGNACNNMTLAVRWQHPDADCRILLPGIYYYGNPSGVQSNKVPCFQTSPGGKGFYEEHRYPMTFAVCESQAGTMAALHTVPSQVPAAQRSDLWWSLGAEYRTGATELAAYSGYVSDKGMDGMVKASQTNWLEMPDANMRFTDNLIVEKTFYLQIESAVQRGNGFAPAVDAALRIWQLSAIHLDLENLLKIKYDYALSRWFSNERSAGNLFTPDRNDPYIVYGWCGRNETMGYAAPILGKLYNDPEAEIRAKAVFDFLCTSPMNEEGFCTTYQVNTNSWSDRNFVSQGQTLETFTSALLRMRQNQQPIPEKYMVFLEQAANVLAERILQDNWYPVSTNEGFLGAPLVNAGKLLNNSKFTQAAIKLADHYIQRHLSMDEPYWGGTLDACCEDKEGAVAAMTAFFAVWKQTGDKKYLKAAEHATQVFLTYLQLWDIPMPPGRLADNGFQSRGWTAVSVQNMHLDVYGVFVTPLLYEIGKALNRPDWQKVALPMLINCGQLLDPYGSQGEQIQQTNYAQRPPFEPLEVLRGGYVEEWTVFWITAAFLNAGAQFKAMNVF